MMRWRRAIPLAARSASRRVLFGAINTDATVRPKPNLGGQPEPHADDASRKSSTRPTPTSILALVIATGKPLRQNPKTSPSPFNFLE